MKSLFAFILMTLSGLSFADIASFSVDRFEGEMRIEPSDVKITKLAIYARNQFCNFWGTTCAGGPSDEKMGEILFKHDSASNLIRFRSQKPIAIKSWKPANNFSSCNLTIYAQGVNHEGEKYSGQMRIIWENNKDICESKTAIKDSIAEMFKVPQKLMLHYYR
jgi:hypothetical protein